MVAQLWVNQQLALSDILDAPPQVFGAAVRLIVERNTKQTDEASFDRLHSVLREAG